MRRTTIAWIAALLIVTTIAVFADIRGGAKTVSIHGGFTHHGSVVAVSLLGSRAHLATVTETVDSAGLRHTKTQVWSTTPPATNGCTITGPDDFSSTTFYDGTSGEVVDGHGDVVNIQSGCTVRVRPLAGILGGSSTQVFVPGGPPQGFNVPPGGNQLFVTP